MDELNLEGIFWPIDRPDDQVVGRLTFDRESGAELDLIESFHPLEKLFGEIEQPVQIHGVAGGKTLTILDCYRTNWSMEIPGIGRQRYRSATVLSGAHVLDVKNLDFGSVRFHAEHLENWIRKTGTTVEVDFDDQTNAIKKVQITNIPLDNEVIQTEFGSLELAFSSSFNPNVFPNVTLAHKTAFVLKFAKRRPLPDIKQMCSAIRNLITIGIDAPSSIMDVRVTHPSYSRRTSNGDDQLIQLELHSNLLEDTTQKKEGSILPHLMLFSFEDIGELDGVHKWLTASAKYKAVMGSLLSHWYLPSVYTDNRLLNVIIASETLARIRLNRQNINFGLELRGLADYAGDPFSTLVQDVGSWVNEIVRARINNLVHRGLHDEIDTERMFWLSESVYFLVVLCLLKECGVLEATLRNMEQHRRFRNVSKGLQNAR